MSERNRSQAVGAYLMLLAGLILAACAVWQDGTSRWLLAAVALVMLAAAIVNIWRRRQVGASAD